MTKAQVKRFQRVLIARKRDLEREMASRLGQLDAESLVDPIEQMSRLADQEVVVRNVDQMSAVLRAVDRALRTIADGTFGRCARCDREIPMKRLEVVPWSPFCVACQERVEQSAAAA